jgi:hypothetical protein
VKYDRNTPNNKTDFIIRGNEKGMCLLIDTANLGDRHMFKAEAEKILNSKNKITIKRMWN